MQFFYPTFLRANASSRKRITLIFSLLFFSLVVNAQNTTAHALDFDGTDDKVTIPDNNSLDMTSNYTLEAWIYPTQFIHLGGIIDKYQSANANGYMIRLDGTSGKMSFDERVTTNNVLTLNTWNHVAAVNSNGTRRLYVNGVEVALGSSSFNVIANGDPLCLGIDWNSASRSFKGRMDEVRVWNVARTATQISESMNRMMVGNETGLVAYYRFDQGTAGGANTALTTLTNLATATGSALNGTLSGFSLNNAATSNWVTGYSSFWPLVSTTTASSVLSSSASSGGNVVHEGGASVTRGVVWSTTAGPTVSLSTKTNNGTGTGSFTSSITGLSPNTTYYYRAYATNSNGTTYGSELSFTTLQVAPSISYPSASYTFERGSAITPVPLTNTGGAPDPLQVSTLAGGLTDGRSDGVGTSARFRVLEGITVDGNGNVYVADWGNYRIRKIDPAGIVTTFAGSNEGSFDAQGIIARFKRPAGVATDANGNVYVADAFDNKIRKIDPAGVVSTVAGSGTTGAINANGTNASFNYPFGVAVDASGNVYVSERNNHQVRKIDPAGNVTTLAGTTTSGFQNGTGTAARFATPRQIATDGNGNIYLADYSNSSIRRITPAGDVTTIAGSSTWGFLNGVGTAARFHLPYSVAVDNSGNIYVADGANHMIRKITSAGVVSTYAGSTIAGHNDGALTTARFNGPKGVAVASNGTLYITDNGTRVRIIAGYRIDPALPEGLFFNPSTGQISGTPTTTQAPRTYTIYAENSAGAATTQIIIGVSSSPTVTTQAASNITATSAKLNATVNANGGNTTALSLKYSTVQADVDAGNGTTATINPASVSGISNTAITADVTGLTPNTIYYFRVSATNSSGTANGTTLSFITGPAAPIISYGTSSVTVGVGTSISPMTVTNTGGQIVDPMIVTTFAGNGQYGYTNGTGSSAEFYLPYDLTVDPSGNVFVADLYNQRIRKIDPLGVVSTWAGNGTSGFADGQGTAAIFNGPFGIESDASGNLYVSDYVSSTNKCNFLS